MENKPDGDILSEKTGSKEKEESEIVKQEFEDGLNEIARIKESPSSSEKSANLDQINVAELTEKDLFWYQIFKKIKNTIEEAERGGNFDIEDIRQSLLAVSQSFHFAKGEFREEKMKEILNSYSEEDYNKLSNDFFYKTASEDSRWNFYQWLSGQMLGLVWRKNKLIKSKKILLDSSHDVG